MYGRRLRGQRLAGPILDQVLNEDIKDLLVTGNSGTSGEGNAPGGAGGGLPLRENLQGEVAVAGLSQHEVIYI